MRSRGRGRLGAEAREGNREGGSRSSSIEAVHNIDDADVSLCWGNEKARQECCNQVEGGQRARLTFLFHIDITGLQEIKWSNMLVFVHEQNSVYPRIVTRHEFGAE